jgi:hypothetical protein
LTKLNTIRRSLTAEELKVVEALYKEYEQEAGDQAATDGQRDARVATMSYFDDSEWCAMHGRTSVL